MKVRLVVLMGMMLRLWLLISGLVLREQGGLWQESRGILRVVGIGRLTQEGGVIEEVEGAIHGEWEWMKGRQGIE